MAAEEWCELALKQQIESNSIGKKIVLGLGAMLAGSAFLSPLVGVPLGVGIIWDAFSKSKESKHVLDLIVHHGCVAPFLDDYEFRQYLKQIGAPAIIEQLKFAIDEEIDLSDAAHNFMMTANPAKQLPGSAPSPQLAASQGVIQDSPTLIQCGVTVDQSEDIPDLIGLMAEPLKNSLIVGVPGAGKDYFVSNAIAAVKTKNPDTVIFLVDPKNDSKEDGYFQYCDFKYREDIEMMSEEETYDFLMGKKGAITQYDEYCKEHQNSPAIKLLIINELPALLKKVEIYNKKALQRIKAKFASYASSGGSRGRRIWGMAQNAHVEGCGLNSADKSIFSPIVIARDESINEILNILSAKLIASELIPSAKELSAICKKSPVGRAIFHGAIGDGKWFPMPEMPNLSGYNRDKGTFAESPHKLSDSLSGTERESLDKMIATLEPEDTATVVDLPGDIVPILQSCDRALDSFIREDLGASDDTFRDIKFAILSDLKEQKNVSLLKKFKYEWLLDDPIKAIKKSKAKTDEQLKDNWFYLTGKTLNEGGLQELKSKIEK